MIRVRARVKCHGEQLGLECAFSTPAWIRIRVRRRESGLGLGLRQLASWRAGGVRVRARVRVRVRVMKSLFDNNAARVR